MGKSLDFDGSTTVATFIDTGGTQFIDRILAEHFYHGIWFFSRSTSASDQFLAGYPRRTSGSVTQSFDMELDASGDGNANKVVYIGGTGVSGQVILVSSDTVAGDNQWHFAELLGITTGWRAYLDGVFQAAGAGGADYDYADGGNHRYCMGAFKNDAGTSQFFDGFITEAIFGVVSGGIGDTDAQNALALAHYNEGFPLVNTGISDILHGYSIEGSTIPSTVDDDIASPGAANLTTENMVSGDIVSDFPAAPAVDGGILPRIISPVLPLVINPVF